MYLREIVAATLDMLLINIPFTLRTPYLCNEWSRCELLWDLVLFNEYGDLLCSIGGIQSSLWWIMQDSLKYFFFTFQEANELI